MKYGKRLKIYLAFLVNGMNHMLFHYIGFLLAVDNKNKDKFIKESISLKLTKDEFIEYLKNEIAKSINIKKGKRIRKS